MDDLSTPGGISAKHCGTEIYSPARLVRHAVASILRWSAVRETDLLEHIYAANDELTPTIHIPPGDDMAAMPFGDTSLLVAVDQLIDGRHVRLERTPIELVGAKAIKRCVSDVAAMAARPAAALVAVTLPIGLDAAAARTLFDAVRRSAATYGCPLIGGDIAMHDAPGAPLTMSVTVLATPGPTPPVRRNGARAGDGVYVTGQLGATLDEDGGGHHLHFIPRVAEALALATTLGPRLHAMIDLSDGLARDGAHLARPDVRLELDADTLPRRPGATTAGALGDGEDYELCLTAAGPVPEAVHGVPVTRIGTVVPRPTGDDRDLVVTDSTGELPIDQLGWEHRA